MNVGQNYDIDTVNKMRNLLADTNLTFAHKLVESTVQIDAIIGYITTSIQVVENLRQTVAGQRQERDQLIHLLSFELVHERRNIFKQRIQKLDDDIAVNQGYLHDLTEKGTTMAGTLAKTMELQVEYMRTADFNC